MKSKKRICKTIALLCAFACLFAVSFTATADEGGKTPVDPPVAVDPAETPETPETPAAVDRGFTFSKQAMQGKAFAFYGDSLTARHGLKAADIDYVQHLQKQYGFYYYNGAVSGATWTVDATDSNKNNVFEQFKRATYINRDIDYVSLMLGTNDYGWGLRELGEATDHATSEAEATTVYGAIRYALDLLIEANPDVKIMLMTPPLWYGKTGKDADGNDAKGNSVLCNRTDKRYSLDDLSAVVKTVGAEYGCKVVDNADVFTLSADDSKYYITGDLLHISPLGHEKLAQHIAEFGNEENV